MVKGLEYLAPGNMAAAGTTGSVSESVFPDGSRPDLAPKQTGSLLTGPRRKGRVMPRIGRVGEIWLGDLDLNQGCAGQSREFYR